MSESLFPECNLVARSFSERHIISKESKYVCSLKLRTTKTFMIQVISSLGIAFSFVWKVYS